MWRKGDGYELIERFCSEFGPGQLGSMWPIRFATRWGDSHAVEGGSDSLLGREWRERVVSIDAVNENGERQTFAGDYFFSTMPSANWWAMDAPIPTMCRGERGLQYRDFITVGCWRTG